MLGYSTLNKLIHKIYLNNYFLSQSTLDFEIDRFSRQLKSFDLQKIVFITGLARSGTTSVLRMIYQSNEFSSLLYKNMPFLFLVNTFKNNKTGNQIERAHKDGILINNNSPEEFDEYFWKVHLKDSYILDDKLVINEINNKIIDKYLDYVKLICISYSKNKYLSKNNNLILRINQLKNIPNSTFIIMVRNPLDHASSLLKLHKKFSKEHKQDKFNMEYFNFLGHHEFGLNHKPFYLNTKLYEELQSLNSNDINYWLIIWKSYYKFILNMSHSNFIFILFEDLIFNRKKVIAFLSKKLEININSEKNSFQPPKYQYLNTTILDDCIELYNLFKEKVRY